MSNNVAEQQGPRGLHLRSTLVGSILSGIGVGAGIALLAMIGLSFNPNHLTEAQLWQELGLVTGVYAAGGAVVFAGLALLLQGAVSLVSRGSSDAKTAASCVMAVFSGALFSAGLGIWQLILVKADGLVALAAHAACLAGTGLLIYGLWAALSALFKVRASQQGVTLSRKLALYAACSSVIPWAWLVISIAIRP